MNIEGLSLDQMRVALAVQETGSFAGAAKRFGRAQSAVSYAISTLEGQLGVTLFDRSGHRSLPTPQSVTLLREIAAIVARCDALRSRADALSTGVEPVIRVVLDQLYDAATAADILSDFQKTFPSTRVELRSECMEDVIRRVEEGFDLGVLASLATVPPHIASSTIKPISLVPVAAREWHLLCEQFDMDTLRAQGVQIVLGTHMRDAGTADFLVFGARTWRVDHIATKLALLKAGAGWGYMPEHLIRNSLAKQELVLLSPPGLPAEDHQPVFIIWHQSRAMGPAASWLRERLQREAG